MSKKNDYPKKSFKTVEIMQEVSYGFDGAFLNDLTVWTCIKDFAWIKHDKDVKEDGTPKAEHIHCMIRFKNSTPTENILKYCDSIKEGVIKFQHLQKAEYWSSAIAYLTHANAPEKYQYSFDDVNSNYKFQEDIKKALNNPKKQLEELYSKIETGECRPYNLHLFVDKDFFHKYSKVIDDYFKYHQLVIDEKMKGDRNMRLIYVQGDSECGKTTFAKKLCEGMNWSFYVSSGGNNPLDNYKNEDCIILDDFRPRDFAFNEFLKLTDNHTSSMAHSRYYDKSLAYCRCLIVTSILPITAIYHNLTNSLDDKEREEAKQVKRRFGEVYEVHKDSIDILIWDSESGSHKFVRSIFNPVSALYNKSKEEELLSRVSKVLDVFGIPRSVEGEQLTLDGFTPTNEPTPWHNSVSV